MANFNWNLRGKLKNLVQLSVLKTSHINYEIVQPRKHTHTHTHTHTHNLRCVQKGRGCANRNLCSG